MFSTRSIYIVLLWLVLLPSTCASAGDYTVAYAFDAGDLNDAGKKGDCEYSSFCLIKSEKLKLSISLSFWHPDHREVDIHLYGNKERPACCYFADGVDSVVSDARGSLIRLHVFEGHARIRNEFIQNVPLGILYLQFSNAK